MALGDIYYSDGAMTHQSEALASGKTPIGIVGYLGNDYWTEKGVSGKGGHALVMCLKTIGSTGKTSIGKSYVWYSSNIDAGRTKVTSKSDIVNSYYQSYGSGYTETNALIKNGAQPQPQLIRHRITRRFLLTLRSVPVGFYHRQDSTMQ